MSIFGDTKLLTLIAKGPSYREQNCIDSRLNEKICKESVAAYKCKWAKENVDTRVLSEWKYKVNEGIVRRIRILSRKHINKRKNMFSDQGSIWNICKISNVNL